MGSCPVHPQVARARCIHQSGRECQNQAVSDGEDGANPSRCRHCKRGVICRKPLSKRQ